MTDILLTYDEAAKYLHVSKMTIRRMIKEHKIKMVRVTERNVRIPNSEVERILEGNVSS